MEISDKYLIDQLRREDLQRINELFNHPAISKFFISPIPIPIEKTLLWYEEVLKKRERGTGECFVARSVDDNMVLGWSYWYFDPEMTNLELRSILAPYLIHNDNNLIGYLAVITVDPSFRRLKIGNALMLKGHEFLRSNKTKIAWLGTNEDNIPFKSLIERLGYTLVGRIPNYKKRENGQYVGQDIYLKKFE